MERVPKLRFPGFSGEWEEKRLGDIFEFYPTNSYSRNQLNENNGEVMNIHYGDIHMKYPTILDIKENKLPFINRNIDTNRIKEEAYCREGDVIIADASEDYADIGKSIEIKNVEDKKIVAGLHTLLARDNKNIIENGFKGYMLLNNSVRKQIKVLAVGSKVLGISKANIKKVKLDIPLKEEQKKITSFLTLLDRRIEKQQEKIEALKEYKKGLMQKIFSQQIRFKDDDGNEFSEWKEGTVNDVISLDLKPVKKPNQAYWRLGLRSHGKGTFHEIVDNPNEISMETLYKVEKNELIVNITFAWEHAIAVTNAEDEGKLVSHRFPTYKFKNGAYFDFYKHYFLRKKFKYQLKNASPGGAGRNRVLNKKEFLKIPIEIPEIKEQKKIAELINKFDIKINYEIKRLEIIQKYKKGLLQQMFV